MRTANDPLAIFRRLARIGVWGRHSGPHSQTAVAFVKNRTTGRRRSGFSVLELLLACHEVGFQRGQSPSGVCAPFRHL